MYEWTGAAKVNEASEILQADGLVGTIMIKVSSFKQPTDTTVPDVVASFAKKGALASPLTTDQDTAVSGENTGYAGNASDLHFTGQTLNNLPIIPKTVAIIPQAGGHTVNADDLNGDGVLYTRDADLDVCGSIDYHTGALALDYPTGKDPNNGVINANYKYSRVIKGLGSVSFKINNMQADEVLYVYACAEAAACMVKVEIFGGNA
jgi:hypothetical protein